AAPPPGVVSLDPRGGAGALAVEALTVELGVDEAARVLAVIDPGLTDAERLDRLRSQVALPTEGDGWVAHLVEDPDGAWRSPWLRACAIHSAAARGVLAT